MYACAYRGERLSGEVSSDFWLPDATERQSPAGAILDPDTLSPRSKASLGLEPGRTGCKLATKGTKGTVLNLQCPCYRKYKFIQAFTAVEVLLIELWCSSHAEGKGSRENEGREGCRVFTGTM